MALEVALGFFGNSLEDLWRLLGCFLDASWKFLYPAFCTLLKKPGIGVSNKLAMVFWGWPWRLL